MAAAIPQYIEDRIRRAIPADSHVIAGSTPVVSFGNSQTARVATLGLNPSKIEFLHKTGELRRGAQRRLATQESLGVTDLSIAPLSKVMEVLEACNAYFQQQPYRKWFDQLMPMLSGCDASYYDGSACHLDLIQWATDPTWSGLDGTVREQLVAEDAGFLAGQLQSGNLRLVLVNGNSVWKQMKRSMANELKFNEVEPICGFARCSTRLFVGTVFSHIRVVAWSTNIQSSFGVTTALREELTRRIVALAR